MSRRVWKYGGVGGKGYIVIAVIGLLLVGLLVFLTAMLAQQGREVARQGREVEGLARDVGELWWMMRDVEPMMSPLAMVSPLAVATATVEPGTAAWGIYWEYSDGRPGYATREYEVESTVEVPRWVLVEEHELRRGGEIVQRWAYTPTMQVPTEVGSGLFVNIPLPTWDQEFVGMATDWCRVRWHATDGDELIHPCLDDRDEIDGPDGRGFGRVREVWGGEWRLYMPWIAVGGR